jgi:hypothetical protein
MTDQRPRKLALFRDTDNPGGLWRVEWSDSEGAIYITIYSSGLKPSLAQGTITTLSGTVI